MPEVCDTIAGPAGESLLQFMRVAYLHRRRGEPLAVTSTTASNHAFSLGLVRAEQGQLILTETGKLLGPVALAYCAWLDHDRALPEPTVPESHYAGKDVLELGCGIGLWLWEFATLARSVTAIEPRREYVELSKALSWRENIDVPKIMCSRLENTTEHVEPASKDFVFSRRSISFSGIRRTLNAAYTILRPGGLLRIEVDLLRDAHRQTHRDEYRQGLTFTGWKDGLCSRLFSLTGLQIHKLPGHREFSPYRPVFPTVNRWRREFLRSGFEDFSIVNSHSPLVIEAVKRVEADEDLANSREAKSALKQVFDREI